MFTYLGCSSVPKVSINCLCENSIFHLLWHKKNIFRGCRRAPFAKHCLSFMSVRKKRAAVSGCFILIQTGVRAYVPEIKCRWSYCIKFDYDFGVAKLCIVLTYHASPAVDPYSFS